MSRITSSGPSSNAQTLRTTGNDLSKVDLDQFLNLMLAELQNQDPLNPLDNAEMVQQISQIREIGATNQLTETLSSVAAGQNLATASGLIGRTVKALSDANENISGVVERVTVEVDRNDDSIRKYRVQVDGKSVDLKNIREVVE